MQPLTGCSIILSSHWEMKSPWAASTSDTWLWGHPFPKTAEAKRWLNRENKHEAAECFLVNSLGSSLWLPLPSTEKENSPPQTTCFGSLGFLTEGEWGDGKDRVYCEPLLWEKTNIHLQEAIVSCLPERLVWLLIEFWHLILSPRQILGWHCLLSSWKTDFCYSFGST